MPRLDRALLQVSHQRCHEQEPHATEDRRDTAAQGERVEARRLLDEPLEREDHRSWPLAAQVGEGVEHRHIGATDALVAHPIVEGHLRHEHGGADHRARHHDDEAERVHVAGDGAATGSLHSEGDDEPDERDADGEPRLVGEQPDAHRLRVCEEVAHIGLSEHANGQHDGGERREVLLGHLDGLVEQLEGDERVERGERRLAREQHEREQPHRRQLHHEDHLLVGCTHLAEDATLGRAKLVAPHGEHPQRRTQEDPAPEGHEAAERGQAERVEAEEADVRQEVAERLADGVARGALPN
eukprot:4216023-Prymnesium_polylepis.1